MRALFTIKLIQKKNQELPLNSELLSIFSSLGLHPTDMPDANIVNTQEINNNVLQFFVERAAPILERMPSDNEAHRLKRERTTTSIIYCSVLPTTNTQFMVTRETQGAITFRLINEKIEFLQKGCEELITMFGLSKRCKWRRNFPFELAGRIEIYEHGLEASTIRGALVQNKISYATKHSHKDIVLSIGALLLLGLAITVNGLQIFDTTSKWIQHIDRFSTAMATTFIVSAYAVFHVMLTATPPVQWNAHYELED